VFDLLVALRKLGGESFAPAGRLVAKDLGLGKRERAPDDSRVHQLLLPGMIAWGRLAHRRESLQDLLHFS
jgi:hypothetical protein